MPKAHPKHVVYVTYRNTFNKLKRIAKYSYYQEKLENFKNDIRKTWSILNSVTNRRNNKTEIPDIFKINSKSVSDPNQIANGFCDFFANVGCQLSNKIPQGRYLISNYLKNKVQHNFFLVPTDPHEIQIVINNLNNKCSFGHDGISQKLLKLLNQNLCEPLSILINKSILEGEVPDALKLAKVIPIYKSKDKDNFNNYRPISLLPAI